MELNRLSTPDQVRALFPILTEQERNELSLRRDFSGRIVLDLSRLFHSGSIALGKTWKMPINGTWEPVAEETGAAFDLPQDFVLYLFGAAVQHPWFQAKLEEYYGAIPEVEL